MGQLIQTAIKLQNTFNKNMGIYSTEEKGKNLGSLMARCFTSVHKNNDKNAALSINDKKGVFKCFVCGISGKTPLDLINHFLHHEQSLDINELNHNPRFEKEAKRLYKKMFGYEYNPDNNEKINFDSVKEKGLKQEIMNKFYDLLKEEKPTKKLLDYFKNRGIKENTLNDRGIIDLTPTRIEKIKTKMIEHFGDKDNEDYIFPKNKEEFLEIIETYINLNKNKTFKSKDKEISLKDLTEKDKTDAFEKMIDKDKSNELSNQIINFVQGIRFLQEYSFLTYNFNMVCENHHIVMPFFINQEDIYGKKNEKNEKRVEAIQFRTLDKNAPKNKRFLGYGALSIYNKDLLENSEYIIITEGGSDANTLIQLGHPAISIPGASNGLSPQEINLFLGKNVYILGDNDGPGQEFIKNINELLKNVVLNNDENGDVKILKVPESTKEQEENWKKENPEKEFEQPKDFNEWHQKFNKEELDPIKEFMNNKELKEVKKVIYTPYTQVGTQINTVLGLHTTTFKNRIGSFDDTIKYLDDNDIKKFMITENTLMNIPKYIEYAQKNKKIFIPSIKVKLNNHYITIVFQKQSHIDILKRNIIDNNISLTNLNNLPEDISVILPLSMNKLLLKKDLITKENTYIGISANIDEKYLPNKFSKPPMILNDNLYLDKKDELKYEVYNCISNNQKIKISDLGKNRFIKNRSVQNKTDIEKQIKEVKNPKKKEILENILNNTKNFEDKYNNNPQIMLSEKPNLPNLLEDPNGELNPKKLEDAKSIFRKMLVFMWDKNVVKTKFGSHYTKEVKKWESRDLKAQIPKENHQVYVDRIEKELDILCSFGDTNYIKYFVILKDIVEHLKSKGHIIRPGRGSAAGSLIGYLLGLHEVDPIEYNLLFERFLNTKRNDYPDFDLDLSNEAKEELLKYLNQKYKNVRHIKVVGKMGDKGTISNTLRILGENGDTIGKVSEEFDEGKTKELDKILSKKEGLTESVKDLYTENRNNSIHPSAVIIDDDEFNYDLEYKDGMKILNTTADNLGKIKFDFLSSKELSILEEIKKDRKKLGFENLPLSDKKTWREFKKGNTLGIPQFASKGMVYLLKQVEPNNMEELSAVLALYRPGPIQSGMKDKYVLNKKMKDTFNESNLEFIKLKDRYPEVFKEKDNIENLKLLAKKYNKQENRDIQEFINYQIKFLNKNKFDKKIEDIDEYKEVTKETYGTIIYQEQIMLLLNKMAGYKLEDTNEIRKAISKKNTEEIQKYKEEIVQKLQDNNEEIDKETAEYLFEEIAKFAEYSFNKSHSVAYAINSYMFMLVKTHYYLNFYMATKKFKPEIDLPIGKQDIQKPKINLSNDQYQIMEFKDGNKKIIEPLSNLHYLNVNKSAMEEIIKKSPFKDFQDFLDRIDRNIINDKLIYKLRNDYFFWYDKNKMKVTRWRKDEDGNPINYQKKVHTTTQEI